MISGIMKRDYFFFKNSGTEYVRLKGLRREVSLLGKGDYSLIANSYFHGLWLITYPDIYISFLELAVDFGPRLKHIS